MLILKMKGEFKEKTSQFDASKSKIHALIAVDGGEIKNKNGVNNKTY